GFGNVNRALLRLLQQREQELRDRYEIEWHVTGVASRRLGWLANPGGFDPELLNNPQPGWERLSEGSPASINVRQWLRAAQANVLFEATSLKAQTGHPAIDHIRAALESEAHAI